MAGARDDLHIGGSGGSGALLVGGRGDLYVGGRGGALCDGDGGDLHIDGQDVDGQDIDGQDYLEAEQALREANARLPTSGVAVAASKVLPPSSRCPSAPRLTLPTRTKLVTDSKSNPGNDETKSNVWSQHNGDQTQQRLPRS